MSSLMHAGDPPVTRCAICQARDAAGPCARCRKSVCGDCCELTDGGATTFAICVGCAKRGGTSLAGAWWSTLVWLGMIILVLAALGVGLMLLRR